MILSWRLWRATFFNSLYNFPLLLSSPEGRPRKLPSLPRRVLIALVVLGIAYIVFVQPTVIPTMLGIGFVLLILFAGTISGWAAALRISRAIFREQEKGRYELLLLTPPGVLGVHWAIVTRYLRDDKLLKWLRWLPSGFYIFAGFPLLGLLLAMIATSILWIFTEDRSYGLFALFQAAWGLLLLVVLYSDYIQSVVTGILVGILLPTFARNQSENSAYSVASAFFFSVQFSFYLVYGLVALSLFNIFLSAMERGEYLIVWGMTFVLFVVMVSVREVVIRLLWRTAEERLYFDAQESGIKG
jgi:hypothetical protein